MGQDGMEMDMGAPQSGADIYRDGKKIWARSKGATYCKGNESGPAPKAGTLREDMGRSANSERHIRNGDGMGMPTGAQLVADGYGETQGYGGNGGDGA